MKEGGQGAIRRSAQLLMRDNEIEMVHVIQMIRLNNTRTSELVV